MSSNYANHSTNEVAESLLDITSDLGEAFLDHELESLVKNYGGVLEEIPVLKTLIAFSRIGKSARDLHMCRKLKMFVKALQNRSADPEAKEKMKQKLCAGDSSSKDMAEYLEIIIDRFIDVKKPEMLVALLVAYIDDEIDQVEFKLYSQILERLLPGDYRYLYNNQKATTFGAPKDSSLLRLVGLGLMVEEKRASAFESRLNGHLSISTSSIDTYKDQKREYCRTEFGNKFIEIVDDDGLIA